MSARDEAMEMIHRICPPHLSADGYGQILAEKFDAHRAEVLAEVTAWLVKKAREFHASNRKSERQQGDTAATLASKIARGAVRPNNLRMLPDPGFFEVDHTYASGTTKFRCEAISYSPGTGERRALGWKYAQVYAVPHWYATALDPDDWARGGWEDTTGTEAAR